MGGGGCYNKGMNINNLLSWANGITKQATNEEQSTKQETGANQFGGALGGLAGGSALGTAGLISPVLLADKIKLLQGNKAQIPLILAALGLGTAGALYGGIKGYHIGSDLADHI